MRTRRHGDNKEPLHLAVSRGHLECVAILLDNGAHVNPYMDKSGCEADDTCPPPNYCSVSGTPLDIAIHSLTKAVGMPQDIINRRQKIVDLLRSRGGCKMSEFSPGRLVMILAKMDYVYSEWYKLDEHAYLESAEWKQKNALALLAHRKVIESYTKKQVD
jgi:hypothetical protein